ncbi:hypothetical protein Golax_010382, partial [Gossypium laxum]|nr:hypothetical protein [Gossypium laxum]
SSNFSACTSIPGIFHIGREQEEQRPAREIVGAFWGTKVMEIVKKHNSGDFVWKRIKLTSTRKANAKKHLHRVW